MTSNGTLPRKASRPLKVEDAKKVKITVVGSGGVGKTSLIKVYAEREFPTSYETTIFDHHPVLAQLDGQTVNIDIHDTAGQEDYDNLRPLGYPGTNVFLICFAINFRESFNNVSQKWVQEIIKSDPKAKIVLVGTKCDLRSVKEFDCVKDSEAVKLVKNFKLKGYVECASKTNNQVNEVFETALRVALNLRETKTVTPSNRPKVRHILRHCTIL